MPTLPYTYKLVHKITNQFYFGYRSANKVPPEEDLGILYFTSSKTVKPIFNEFNIFILKTFNTAIEAYEEEQRLIEAHWQDQLLLNKAFHKKGKKAFRNNGHSIENRAKFGKPGKTQAPLTEEQRAKQLAGIARTRTGKPLSEETKQKLSISHKGNQSHLGIPVSEETKQKISKTLTGRKLPPFSEEHKKRLSEAAKLREAKKKLDNK